MTLDQALDLAVKVLAKTMDSATLKPDKLEIALIEKSKESMEAAKEGEFGLLPKKAVQYRILENDEVEKIIERAEVNKAEEK